MMVSEVERLSREVEALRVRVEALEKRLVPSVEVSARERALLRRRASSPPEDYVPWGQVKEELEEKRR